MIAVVHGAVRDRADVWLATVERQPPSSGVRLVVSMGATMLDRRYDVEWRQIPDEKAPLYVARLVMDELPDGTHGRLWARIDSDQAEWSLPANFRRIPPELPRADSAAGPFTLALSSCFYRQRDASGRIGKLAATLPPSRVPHLKLLCGDQVYLDLPVESRHPSDPEELARHLALNYWRSWSQGAHAGGIGFGGFLAWGANWFMADDHEFWNNYPFATPIARTTWTKSGRVAWANAALTLFDAFQRPPQGGGRTLQRLSIGNPGDPGALELLAIDGRYARTRERSHHPDDLQEVVDWLRSLRGPGVLCLSQPIFEEQAGLFGSRTADAGIVDQEDFGELAAALDAAPHDVLLLSGDIHRGRTAVARGEGARNHIWEVVASPTSLCLMGSYKDKGAHPRFPSGSVRGVAARSVETRARVRQDNVALLGFTRVGPAVRVEVEFWSPGAHTAPIARDSFLLR